MNEIYLKKSIVSLINNEILHIHFKANTEIELSDAVFIVEAMGKLTHGKKFPVLIDAGEHINFSKEAQLFSASEESNLFTKVDAIACNSLAQKLIADFYVKNNNTSVQTQVFKNDEDAMKWLKTFLKK